MLAARERGKGSRSKLKKLQSPQQTTDCDRDHETTDSASSEDIQRQDDVGYDIHGEPVDIKHEIKVEEEEEDPLSIPSPPDKIIDPERLPMEELYGVRYEHLRWQCNDEVKEASDFTGDVAIKLEENSGDTDLTPGKTLEKTFQPNEESTSGFNTEEINLKRKGKSKDSSPASKKTRKTTRQIKEPLGKSVAAGSISKRTRKKKLRPIEVKTSGFNAEQIFIKCDENSEKVSSTSKKTPKSNKESIGQYRKIPQSNRQPKFTRKELNPVCENEPEPLNISAPKPRDMYEEFGLHIAKTLRDLHDEDTFRRVKIKINDILLDALAGHYTNPKDSRLANTLQNISRLTSRAQNINSTAEIVPELTKAKKVSPVKKTKYPKRKRKPHPQFVIPYKNQILGNHSNMLVLPSNSQASVVPQANQNVRLPNSPQTSQSFILSPSLQTSRNVILSSSPLTSQSVSLSNSPQTSRNVILSPSLQTSQKVILSSSPLTSQSVSLSNSSQTSQNVISPNSSQASILPGGKGLSVIYLKVNPGSTANTSQSHLKVNPGLTDHDTSQLHLDVKSGSIDEDTSQSHSNLISGSTADDPSESGSPESDGNT